MPDDKPPRDAATDPTVGAPARTITGRPDYDHTVAAPPAGRAVAKGAPSPFQKTITSPPIASAATLAESIVTSPPPTSTSKSPSTGARSTVGNELRGASIERFTPVDVGRFELLDELARGGLGRVFRGRDPRTGRIVAIKEVLHPQPDIIARFAREALVTANLQHPSIVPVYEVGRWPDGAPFYAMKLVEGRTLEALIAESKTQAERIALLPHVIAVADALAYAHGERVIHRDLKPANILVGAYGETIVIDWGLAKNLATGEEIEALPTANTIPPEANETVAGSVLGTPAYMPPEQAIGEKLDERADVYAIGAILYHALSGTRPFAQAKSLDELLELVAFRTPTPLAQLAPELPPELVAIVEQAMARDPEQRYATAQGLAKDLRAFQAGKLVGAHRYTSWQLVRRWVAQHKAVVGTAAIALGVLIAVGAIGVWRIANERDEATRQRTIAQRERGDAQDARGLAEERFADSLQELARQALLGNEAARALPLATGALANRTTVPAALAVIAAQSRAPFAALVSVIPSLSLGVNAGEASPDGSRFFTASGGDETVRAWDIAKNKEAWRVKAGYMLGLSRDGVHLVTATNAGELVLLRAADGRELARWPVSDRGDPPSYLVWSADHVHFAAGSDRGKVWLGTVGGAPRTLAARETKIIALEFSPTGAELASAADESNAITVYDVASGDARTRIEIKGTVSAVGWLDADHLLVGNEREAANYNVRTRAKELALDHGTWVYGFVAGGPPDKRWLLTFGDGSTARLWDLATRTKIADLDGHNVGVQHAVTSGDWLVTGDELGNGFVWDPRTGERVQVLPRDSVIIEIGVVGDRLVVIRETRQEIWKLPPASASIALIRRIDGHTARIRELAFEGNDVVWTASNDGTVRRTPLAGPTTVFGTAGYTEHVRAFDDPDAKKPPYAHGMRAIRLLPDGKTVVTANEDGALVAWDVATGTQRTAFVGHTGRVREVALSNDGKVLYSVGDTTVRSWILATGAPIASADLGDKSWDVAVFPDDTVATMTDVSPGTVALWTPALVKKPAELERVYTHELPISNGRLVLGTFTQVQEVDSSGRVVASSPQPKVFTTSVGNGPDGPRWLVAGDPRGDIVLRDWATNTIVRSWTASDGIVVLVAFSPDGELVASISGNRVRIWDPHTGSLLAATNVIPALLTQLAWSADGTRLAVAGSAGTVWVWDVRPPAALDGLAAFARCASPWTLSAASLVKAPVDAASCALLAP